jgi:hypothetical protein
MSSEAAHAGNIISRSYHAVGDGFRLVGAGIAGGIQAVGNGYRATGDFFKGKGFATLPTAALVGAEIAVAEVVEDHGAAAGVETDAMSSAAYAFAIDAVLTTAAKGTGLNFLNPERRGVRNTVNVVSALGGSLIQLATTGRLDNTKEVETATPAGITNVVLGIASFVGAWLGNAAGRGLTRQPVRR